MFYAYQNGQVFAGSFDEKKLVETCQKTGIHDYVISQEPPKKEISFETQRRKMLLSVKKWTAKKITGGFISSASGELVRYDSDKDTQLTMQGIALNVHTVLFAEKYPNGYPVRGYAEGATEKSVYMLDSEQVLKWCADLSMHIGACKQAGWAKQAEVNACATKEELEAIVLE